MTRKTVNTLNTISGRVGPVPVAYLDDPDFSKFLVEVPEGTKDYDPEFWKPTDADSHRAKETTKRKSARATTPKKDDVPLWVEEPTSELEIL